MAEIPDFTKDETRDYLARQNDVLGWGPPVDPVGHVTIAQPRTDPAWQPDDPSCVSTYGDSFTQSAEVADEDAYPHQLGLILGCHVTNYGVGGYGTDQALMLFRAQSHLDDAPIVVLGHISENVLRNLNRYRNLLYPGQELFFKPRFVLAEDELEKLPIPVQSPQDFERLRENPERVLELDAFLERPRREFPYSFTVLRWALFDYHVGAALRDIPRHADYYQPGNPHDGLRLTATIFQTFVEEARIRGRTPLVVLMPVGHDLQHAKATGRWADRPLADLLASSKIPFIHAGPALLSRLGDRDPCTLFTSCTAHYNSAGYRLIAEIVADEILQRVCGNTAPDLLEACGRLDSSKDRK